MATPWHRHRIANRLQTLLPMRLLIGISTLSGSLLFGSLLFGSLLFGAPGFWGALAVSPAALVARRPRGFSGGVWL